MEKGIEEQKNDKKFNGGPLLNNVKKKLDVFTVKVNENTEASHGMLLYGPPGTGKTSLMNVIVRKSKYNRK